MIIYGWNTKVLKESPIENYECPNCKEKKSLLLVLASYVHIFGIPFFPYQKSLKVVCSNCEFVSEGQQIHGELRNRSKELKSAVPWPRYMFFGSIAGSIVFLMIVVFGIYTIQQSNIEQKSYLDSPRPGDIYVLKDLEAEDEYKYYLWKVRFIDKDNLYVSSNAYAYNIIVSKLDPEDGFYQYTYLFHKDYPKKLESRSELVKVIRDYSSLSGFNRDLALEELSESEE